MKAGRRSDSPDDEVRIPRFPNPGGARAERRVRLAAVLAFAFAALALAVVFSLGSGSSSPASSGTGLPPGQTTTTVTRRTLTESATVEGTLGYGGTLELYDRLAGTFTWLPKVGAVVKRGGTLFRVDDLPVALMYGSVPAYRALKEGLEGPDVSELNRNLIALGFDPYGAISDEESFGEATAAAVRRWQEAEGLPETGEVELGRIVFAPGARRVTAVHVSLGEDPPARSGSEGPSGEKPGTEESPAGEEAAAEEPPAKESSHERKSAEGKPGAESEGSGSKKPSKESKGKGSREASAEEGGGASEGNGSNPGAAAPVAVLGTTSTSQLVQLELSASEQELARVGETAPVTLPDGSVVRGRIAAVGRVAEAGESGRGGPEGGMEEGGGEATISVTLRLDRPVARLDEAPVSVELLKSIRRHVLAVPATALLATAGGGYAVEAIEAGRRVELAVTPGMFADGYVQVEGRGVHAGLEVTEPAE